MLTRILKIIFAVLLLYSGYENLFPIESMEYRFVQQNLASWHTVGIMARLLIAMKWVLAFFLILENKTSRFTFCLLILVFLPHLNDSYWRFVADDIVVQNSFVDVFGAGVGAIFFLLLFAVLIYLERNAWKEKWFSGKKYVNGTILAVGMLPFIFNPVFPENWQNIGESMHEDAIKIDTLLPADLKEQDRLLISFYSTNCPHCIKAAQKIAVAQDEMKTFPKNFVFFIGTEAGVQHFMRTANVELEYKILDSETFVQLNGPSFPGFMLKEQGNLVKKWDGRTFNYRAVPSLFQYY